MLNTQKAKSLYRNGPSNKVLAAIAVALGLNFFASCSVLMRGDPGKTNFAFVQMSDGSVVQAKATGPSNRTTETVEAFASQWIVSMLTWDGKNDGMVAFRQKVPENFFKLSFVLDTSIRETVALAWMEAFQASSYVNTKKRATQYVIRNVISAKTEGGWDVEIYGDRLLIENGSQVGIDPYNVRLSLLPVTPTPLAMGNDSTELSKLIFETRKHGLTVVNVEQING